MERPTALVILDGFGYSTDTTYNAIAQAHTPMLTYLHTHYPHTTLRASGEAVGLLDGAQGNSEVGHLTIGAGRIIKQPIRIMHELIENHQLTDLPVIKKEFSKLAQQKGTLHLMGLISDAGVHGHIDHLLAFIDIAQHYHIAHIAIHCFLDGRDTPPQSAVRYLERIDQKIRTIPEAFIASMCGRFYAMDRNKEWNRTQQTYDMLTQQQPIQFANWHEALTYYYDQKLTDEFIPPTQLNQQGTIKNGDGIIFFNTRPDRARQLTQAFIDTRFGLFPHQFLSLAFFITPTSYGKRLNTNTLIQKEPIHHTLMEVLCQNNFSTYTIAETEKYAHVTYFFNGGRESTFPNETRTMVPSITATNYIQLPEMQAAEITKNVLQSLDTSPCNFYLINYANPDMVGHSGDLSATIKAVECVDNQVEKLYKKIVQELDGTLYVTADHGNAELMYDIINHQPYTAHTANPVEFIMINRALIDKLEQLPLKELKDIAPFVLKNFNIPVPEQMKT